MTTRGNRRDDFALSVKRALAARVAFRCSREGCGAVTAGPNSDPMRVVNIGVAAHITAASPGGPRYSSNLTTEERRSITNAIWLCQDCAKLVDDDPASFSVETLTRWKVSAEQRALFAIGRPQPQDFGAFRFRTIRLQNVGFLFSDEPWPFRVDQEGEDANHPLNPECERLRYSTAFPTESLIRIPSVELSIDFTLENHSPSLAIVTSASLEVLEVISLPSTCRMNWYLPDLEPHLYEVMVKPEVGEYIIFNKDTFKYGQFEADLFRLGVHLQENFADKIVRFRIIVRGYRESGSFSIFSDREYLLGPKIESHQDDEERSNAGRFRVFGGATKLLTLPGLEEVSKAIAIDKLSDAEIYLSDRISALSEIEEGGMQLVFGVPTLEDCLMIRLLVRLQLRNKSGAILDLKDGLKRLNEKASSQELKTMIEGAESCLRQNGNEYILWLIEQITRTKDGPVEEDSK